MFRSVDPSRDPAQESGALAVLTIIASTAVATSGFTASAAEPARGVVAIDIRAGPSAPAWLAAALQEHVVRELSTYERLAVFPRDGSVGRDCATDRACAVDRYRAAGVDFVLWADARPDELRYELHETWTPSEVRRGGLSLRRGGGLIGLRQDLLRVFSPVLTPGGLLDQKPYRMRPERRIRVGVVRAGPLDAASALTVFVVALGLIFVLPVVFALLVVRDRRRVRPMRWTTTWVALLSAAVAVGVGFGGLSALPAAGPEPGQWLIGLLGGAGWGAFVVVNVRLLLPALPGLDRVAHRDVFRLIRAWLVVIVVRLVALVAYYAPFALGAVVALERWGWWPADAAVILLAPAIGLLAHLWLMSWIRALALYLDERLVTGEAGPDNPWHREVSRYFTGYLRRSGWALDPDVLDSILFLPGRQPGVRCYGGGGSPARIVVDERTLTLAIGAAESEAHEGEEAIGVPDWTAGIWTAGLLVEASGQRRPRASTPRRAVRSSVARRSTVRGDPLTSLTGHHRKQLGQAATLLGYVRPEPGERVPLIADTVEDLEVVRDLLAEHYQWFAPDPDDDDDDTDPTDKDFLFGALTLGVGKVVRHDGQLDTFALALADVASRGPRVLRWPYRAAVALVKTLTGGAMTAVADAYPALHFARHHHLQYLALRWTQNEDGLTVRGTVAELERASAKILGQLRAQRVEDTPLPKDRVRFMRRAVRASRFFFEPLVDRAERRARWAATVLVVVAVLGGLAISIYRAVRYHPTYVLRIAEQTRRYEQSLRSSTQDEGTHGRQTDPTD